MPAGISWRGPPVGEIRLKRAYEEPGPQDGRRVLVDRIWPRGVSKNELALDEWNREVAPSDALRGWFDHEEERWEEFRRRYAGELRSKPGTWRPLLAALEEDETLTLVYGARDREHNNAVVLRDFLQKRAGEAAEG